jgi:hypothetical protein
VTEAHNNDDPQYMPAADFLFGGRGKLEPFDDTLPEWARHRPHTHPRLTEMMEEGAKSTGLPISIEERPFDEKLQVGRFYARLLISGTLTVSDESMHKAESDRVMSDGGLYLARSMIEHMRELVIAYDKSQLGRW